MDGLEPSLAPAKLLRARMARLRQELAEIEAIKWKCRQWPPIVDHQAKESAQLCASSSSPADRIYGLPRVTVSIVDSSWRLALIIGVMIP